MSVTYHYLLFMIIAMLPAGASADDGESTCFGTTANGRLENGVELPISGENFESYSVLAGSLGRTFVHSKVRDVMLETYTVLAKDFPGRKFKYAETGFKDGGMFKPHKTHQNGLSVDFTVPVLNKNNESIYLPTDVSNKWGYDIEFDQRGSYDQYTIDYEAMAAHIVTLDKVAKKHGIGIWRVIFDPGLQPHLYKTRNGKYIKANILIPKKKSWVRHDDHYHVDFRVRCEPLRR